MHSTPWVSAEPALAGLQFIILAWHEAGKVPSADSPFLFFPLTLHYISGVRHIQGPLHWKKTTFLTVVLDFSCPWTVRSPSRACVCSGGKKSWQYTVAWLCTWPPFRNKTKQDTELLVWQASGQEGAGQFVWSGE